MAGGSGIESAANVFHWLKESSGVGHYLKLLLVGHCRCQDTQLDDPEV